MYIISMRIKTTISVFDYTDFRKYLRDYYADQKKADPNFSYRYFAKKAGYNSSSLYKAIAEDRKDINLDQVIKFSRAMKHTKKEAEYFENMVCFNQARSTEEKNRYFERMMKFISPNSKKIDARQYEYFSKWYYPVVRELLSVFDFKDDYAALAQSLNPRLTQDEARKSITVLEKLGFIKKNAQGFYKPVEPSLSTGPDIKSLSVTNFQKSMMELALQAIDRHPLKDRDISSITMSVPKAKIDEIKTEIIAFRKKLVNMTADDKNVDCVCQFNMQFFPLSRLKKES